MARTSVAAVEAIIEVDGAISLAPFIETAAAFVDEIADGSDLAAARLELIERYLAAHCYTLRDPRPVSEHAGPVGATYQSVVALGFKTSHYGQMALSLDTSGILASMSSSRKRASVTWLGTPYEDEVAPEE